MAYWRGQRRMSQQQLADALGKSKSWAEKVERGVRRLDRLSVLQEIATVLRIDLPLLLSREPDRVTPPHPSTVGAETLAALRAALSRYEDLLAGTDASRPSPTGELADSVDHAWLAFQRADYPPLVRRLPTLLADTQLARDPRLLGQVYQLTSAVLRKLGEHHLAWLAADRAVATCRHCADPLLAASAAIHLTRALLATGQPRPAMEISMTVAHRLAPPQPLAATPARLSVYGTLLLLAATGAAGLGDPTSVAELLDQATEVATRVGEGQNHYWTSFGPTAVDLARVVSSVGQGDHRAAVALHRQVVERDAFRQLPPQRRAGHLLDATDAYLGVGDLAGAERTLLAADRSAPGEIRNRPVAREAVTAVLRRAGPTRTGLIPLATALGVVV